MPLPVHGVATTRRYNNQPLIQSFLAWPEGHPVLHVVDTDTTFQRGAVLKLKTTENLWSEIMESPVPLYLSYPQIMRVHQESATTSTSFRKSSLGSVIIIQFSGVKSHNSFSYSEWYNAPLHRIFAILRAPYFTALTLRLTWGSVGRARTAGWALVPWHPPCWCLGNPPLCKLTLPDII